MTKLEPDDQWILGYQLFWTNSNMGYIYKMNLTAVLLMTWWCGFVWTFTHPKSHVFKRHFLIKVAMLDYAPILFNHIYIYICMSLVHHWNDMYTLYIYIFCYIDRWNIFHDIKYAYITMYTALWSTIVNVRVGMWWGPHWERWIIPVH